MMEYSAMDYENLSDFNSHSKFMTQKGWVAEHFHVFNPPLPDEVTARITVVWSRVKGD